MLLQLNSALPKTAFILQFYHYFQDLGLPLQDLDCRNRLNASTTLLCTAKTAKTAIILQFYHYFQDLDSPLQDLDCRNRLYASTTQLCTAKTAFIMKVIATLTKPKRHLLRFGL